MRLIIFLLLIASNVLNLNWVNSDAFLKLKLKIQITVLESYPTIYHQVTSIGCLRFGHFSIFFTHSTINIKWLLKVWFCHTFLSKLKFKTLYLFFLFGLFTKCCIKLLYNYNFSNGTNNHLFIIYQGFVDGGFLRMD